MLGKTQRKHSNHQPAATHSKHKLSHILRVGEITAEVKPKAHLVEVPTFHLTETFDSVTDELVLGGLRIVGMRHTCKQQSLHDSSVLDHLLEAGMEPRDAPRDLEETIQTVM